MVDLLPLSITEISLVGSVMRAFKLLIGATEPLFLCIPPVWDPGSSISGEVSPVPILSKVIFTGCNLLRPWGLGDVEGAGLEGE